MYIFSLNLCSLLICVFGSGIECMCVDIGFASVLKTINLLQLAVCNKAGR